MSTFPDEDVPYPLPLFPPQKNIRDSSLLKQAAKPDLAFGILKGSFLKQFCLRLNSSISPVRHPSACLPPKIKMRDLDIASAANFVLAAQIGATSFQTPL